MQLHATKNLKRLRFSGGEKVGVLTVIRPVATKHFRRGVAVVFECRCECGKRVERDRQTLIRNAPRYCGPRCGLQTGTAPEGASTHPLHKRWRHMIDRCGNPANKSFADYGQRGIKVCNRWRFGEGDKTGFECFIEDMGPLPRPELTLERSNSDGHYEPGNCCWATRTTQSRNRRFARIETYQGRSQPVSAWAEEFGIPYFTLSMRLRRGWPIERALTEPIHPR